MPAEPINQRDVSQQGICWKATGSLERERYRLNVLRAVASITIVPAHGHFRWHHNDLGGIAGVWIDPSAPNQSVANEREREHTRRGSREQCSRTGHSAAACCTGRHCWACIRARSIGGTSWVGRVAVVAGGREGVVLAAAANVVVGDLDPLDAHLEQQRNDTLRERHLGREETSRVVARRRSPDLIESGRAIDSIISSGGGGHCSGALESYLRIEPLMDLQLLAESVLVDQRQQGMVVREGHEVHLGEACARELLASLHTHTCSVNVERTEFDRVACQQASVLERRWR